MYRRVHIVDVSCFEKIFLSYKTMRSIQVSCCLESTCLSILKTAAEQMTEVRKLFEFGNSTFQRFKRNVRYRRCRFVVGLVPRLRLIESSIYFLCVLCVHPCGASITDAGDRFPLKWPDLILRCDRGLFCPTVALTAACQSW